jgi:ectoine hydroxylase-related dioxygenase (phytanoyl-CoA dioxygenase family)
MGNWRFDDDERRRFDEDGFVVRRGVFPAGEVDDLAAASEELVAELVKDRHGMRMPMGSYVFEPDFTAGLMIKWEGDSDVMHGVEPCAHLHDRIHDVAYDQRLIDPMRDIVGDDAPVLFTEKLNLKRPHVGGANPLHQDFPYWEDVADDATRVATAIVFLDDATLANGCLRVLPGSHRQGVWATRTDGDFFAHNETDPSLGDGRELVPVEVEAGSIVLFGPYLVHASEPNRSDTDRRAMLYSYQPAGSTHMMEKFMAMAPSRRS